MTRILAYNILLGGTPRLDHLDKVIRSAQPDIVGLVEATNANVVEELAARSHMQFCLSGRGKQVNDWQVALLSRQPIISTKLHTRPEAFTRRHLLEVCVEGTNGEPLTIFVIHLTAAAHRGKSREIRRREVQELLKIMAPHKGTPHLVMGDFNSLAPGDSFSASELIRHMLRLHGSPSSKYPASLRRRIAITTIRALLNGRVSSALIDRVGLVYAQGGNDLLLDAGYVDCFRRMHPSAQGFTFPSAVPTVRIDYIFASPELAAHLSACEVVLEGEGVRGSEASDHLPLWAEFNTVS